MNVGSVYNIALSGVYSSIDRANYYASNIASENTGDNGGDSNDTVTNMVGLDQARHNYEANMKVIQSADDMYSELLNMS